MTSEIKTGGQILTNAIRHLQRTTMNCRTWTMPIGDDQACNTLNAAFAEYIRQSNRQFMAQFRIKPWSDEFDRINHGPFEHPVSENKAVRSAPDSYLWSECPRCDNGIYNGRECAICWGTGRVTESLLQQAYPQIDEE